MLEYLHKVFNIMNNIKGFEFGFGWLFAIIVGAIIIFLAVFAASRLISQEKYAQNTEAAKQIDNLLSPIENSVEKGLINLPSETKLNNDCSIAGNFGSQKISVSYKSKVGNEWDKNGVESRSYNKYIFSSSQVEGKEFYFFTKPFEFPFRLANIIFLWSDKESYCFINAPDQINEEVTALNLKNLNITSDIKECKKESLKVCFLSSKCDIDVNLNSKSVTKKGKRPVYYEDSIFFTSALSTARYDYSLLYAAIFSDPTIYECQIKRIGKRASELSLLYISKSSSVSAQSGCSSNLQPSLLSYSEEMRNINSSIDLRSIKLNAEELGRKNNDLLCKIF